MDNHTSENMNPPASTDARLDFPAEHGTSSNGVPPSGTSPDGPLDSYEQKQLQDLLNTLCEGMLDVSEAKHLRQLLQRSQEARGTYIQYLHMHASLAYSQTHAANANQPAALVEPRSSLMHRLDEWKSLGSSMLGKRPVVTTIAASLAAIVASVGALILLFSAGSGDTPTPFNRSRVQYVARVVRDVDCRWGEETVATVHGGLLSSKDQLNLLEGLAKVRFDCGAEVILRGPAKLRIDSGMSCFLDSGELSASVPEVAHGFTVHTPRHGIWRQRR